MNLFLSPEDGRLRSGWRLFVQFILMILFLGLGEFFWSQVVLSPGFLAERFTAGAAFVLSTWLAARFLDERGLPDFGLSWKVDWFRELGIGMAIGACVMAFIFVLELSLGWIRFTGFGWERGWAVPYPIPLFEYLAGMMLVGFYEELVFRGYQITNLTEGLGGWLKSTSKGVYGAVLFSSLLFGIMHAGNPNASLISTTNIMLAGIVLAIPYLVTGSLSLSIGIHAAWNFFQGGIFGLPVSGTPARSSLLQVRETGPDLFTGGGFGPEAGLTGIIGLLLITVLLVIYLRKSGYTISIHDSFRMNGE